MSFRQPGIVNGSGFVLTPNIRNDDLVKYPDPSKHCTPMFPVHKCIRPLASAIQELIQAFPIFLCSSTQSIRRCCGTEKRSCHEPIKLPRCQLFQANYFRRSRRMIRVGHINELIMKAGRRNPCACKCQNRHCRYIATSVLPQCTAGQCAALEFIVSNAVNISVILILSYPRACIEYDITRSARSSGHRATEAQRGTER